MPELPDLQVFSKNLTARVVGKMVKKVTVVNKAKLKSTEKEFKTGIEGHKLTRVFREGKELHFEFSNGSVLGLHLMLRGQLNLFEGKNDKKFPIIEILFDDNTGLAMSDFQGQATPTLNPEARDSVDALSDQVDYHLLKEKLGASKASIKNLLLDQHVIRGIGNAYADEILWAAKISPFSVCNKIPDQKIKSLAKAIKSVLNDAEKKILETHPDIISGEVRDFLSVHHPKKKTSPTGGEIQMKTIGGRKTYFTDEQEEFN